MRDRHYRDETLLSYLDGELSGLTRLMVRRHLDRCWRCRAQMDSLEAQIYSLSRIAHEEDSPDPRWLAESTNGLETRIREWERERVPGGPAMRKPIGFRLPALAVAATLVVAAAVSFYYWWRSGTPPDTRDFASAIAPSQQKFEHEPLHQELRLEIRQTAPVKLTRTGRLSVWSQPSEKRYSLRMTSDQGKLLYAVWRPGDGNGFVYNPGVGDQLAAYQPPSQTPQILAVPSGSDELEREFLVWMEARRWHPLALLSDAMAMASQDGYVVTVERAADQRTRFRMTFRKGTATVAVDILLREDGNQYRPLIQKIAWNGANSAGDMVLRTEAFDVLPEAQIRPAMFEPDARFVRPPYPAGTLAPPPLPATTDAASAFGPDAAMLAESEVEVRYALHRAGACLGEPVEVTIDAPHKRIQVRGRVSSAARREELLAALAPVHRAWLSIELLTESEVAQIAERSGGAATIPARIRSYGQVISDGFPLEERLRKYLVSRPGARSGMSLDTQVTQTMNEIYSLSRDSMAEAWALRRLAERYPASALRSQAPSSRWLLEIMFRDHLAGLRTSTAALRSRVLPLLGADAASLSVRSDGAGHSAPWPAPIAPLFARVQDLSTRINALFVGPAAGDPAGNPMSLDQAVAHVISLMEAEAGAEQVADAGMGGLASTSAKSTR